MNCSEYISSGIVQNMLNQELSRICYQEQATDCYRNGLINHELLRIYLSLNFPESVQSWIAKNLLIMNCQECVFLTKFEQIWAQKCHFWAFFILILGTLKKNCAQKDISFAL